MSCVVLAAGEGAGGLGQGRGGETLVTNKYFWKSALSPWTAEVCAAQVNANLLTANKHIKWKLLKKSILKKLVEMSFFAVCFPKLQQPSLCPAGPQLGCVVFSPGAPGSGCCDPPLPCLSSEKNEVLVGKGVRKGPFAQILPKAWSNLGHGSGVRGGCE